MRQVMGVVENNNDLWVRYMDNTKLYNRTHVTTDPKVQSASVNGEYIPQVRIGV